jgi:phosphoribosylformylglycinamidine cyclo-ligase
MHVIKDNLFTPPPIFQLIQQNSGADDREMFQVFNMGHRMEIFVEETAAAKVIALSQQFGVEAKVVGKVVPAENKLLTLQMGEKTIRFEY